MQGRQEKWNKEGNKIKRPKPKLGKTDLDVSIIGLGARDLRERELRDKSLSKDFHPHRMMKQAVELFEKKS